jgi:hypothetical protein
MAASSPAHIDRLSRARFDDHVSVVVQSDHASLPQPVLPEELDRERDDEGTAEGHNPPFDFLDRSLTSYVRRYISIGQYLP